MIEFRFKDEKEIAIHYAKQLNDKTALKILNDGVVRNSDEAVHLREFFWRMVDLSVNDENQEKEVLGHLKRESCMEDLMEDFKAYLISSGYEAEWDDEERY